MAAKAIRNIHNRTHGEDGIYFTYTNENPIAFNPFYVEDGVQSTHFIPF